jgi:hypothetical protein
MATRRELLQLAMDVFGPAVAATPESQALDERAQALAALEERLRELGAQIRQRWGRVGAHDPRPEARRDLAAWCHLLERYEALAR